MGSLFSDSGAAEVLGMGSSIHSLVLQRQLLRTVTRLSLFLRRNESLGFSSH